jgi:hypothetical protein
MSAFRLLRFLEIDRHIKAIYEAVATRLFPPDQHPTSVREVSEQVLFHTCVKPLGWMDSTFC